VQCGDAPYAHIAKASRATNSINSYGATTVGKICESNSFHGSSAPRDSVRQHVTDMRILLRTATETGVFRDLGPAVAAAYGAIQRGKTVRISSDLTTWWQLAETQGAWTVTHLHTAASLFDADTTPPELPWLKRAISLLCVLHANQQPATSSSHQHLTQEVTAS
jgi:hypothetical protein